MEYDWKHIASLVFISISIYYAAQMAIASPSTVANYGLSYFTLFYFPKILPITIMGLYYLEGFKLQILNKGLSLLSWLCFFLTLSVGIMLLIGMILNLSSADFFGIHYEWSYEAALEWVFCFLAAWLLTNMKTEDPLLAMTYSAQAISLGSYMHEFVFGIFNPDFYYHLTYPLLIATPLVSLFFVFLLTYGNQWKAHVLFIMSFMIYVCFMVLYATVFNPNVEGIVHIPTMWFQRIPTILVLITIPLGFKRKREMLYVQA